MVAQVGLFGGYALALAVGGPAASGAWSGVFAVFGIVAVAAAVVLAVGGVRALGAGLTPYPEPVRDAALVDHGVYRLVRHPLYGAVALGAVGGALLAASLWPALGAVVLTVFFFAKSTFEERRLERAHPGYADYRRRVPRRMVPWLL